MSESVAPVSRPRWSPLRILAVRRFFRQPLAVLALVIVLAFGAVALLAPWLSPMSPAANDLRAALEGPSPAHWLGTDDLGRDVLSRMIYGIRTSLAASVQATVLAVVLGVPLGIVAGYLGGYVDVVLSRIAEAFLTFPALLLAVVIIGLTGPGLRNAMIAIGVVYAPRLYRVVRAAVMDVVSETYISAARTIGASPARIMVRNVLPNALSPILVQISLLMGTAILAEASLSFLGLGVQPPGASLGSILGRAVAYMSQQVWTVAMAGTAISILVLSFNILGDGIRDSIGRERRS